MSYIRPVMRPDALVSIAIRRRQSADSIWTVSDQLRECIRWRACPESSY